MKKLSILLVICFVVNIISPLQQVNAQEQNEHDSFIEKLENSSDISNVNEVYHNGDSYITYTDAVNGQVVKKMENERSDNAETELVVRNDGLGEAHVTTDGKTTNYELQVHNLSSDAVDVEIYEDGVLVKHITDPSELDVDIYSGQSAATIVELAIISLLTALAVMVAVQIVIFVGNIIYYSVANNIEEIREIAQTAVNTYPYRWYRAKLDSKEVYIDVGNPLTITQASSRISQGLNTYTFFSGDALGAVQLANQGVVGPEIDQQRKTGYIYYYHYHKGDRTGHSWFGLPYTK